MSEKPTVYLLDNFPPEVTQYCQQTFNAILPGDPTHSTWRKHARFLLIRSYRLSAEDINSCPNLIAIGKQGVGIDKIDAAACAAKSIKILNTPGVNAGAVAELVLALTMAVARQVGHILTSQTQGIAVSRENCSGVLIRGKTIGIIGMGNIGKAVAKMFRAAFDCEVIAYARSQASDAWSEIPHIRAKSIDEVLESADILTLHVPLTNETRGLISYPQMQKMKKTAILINTARGGIINEVDLEVALEEGLIWGAGLDCHEQEPPTKEKYGRLWELGVVSTPHIGAATKQTQIDCAMAAAKNIYEFWMQHDKASNHGDV